MRRRLVLAVAAAGVMAAAALPWTASAQLGEQVSIPIGFKGFILLSCGESGASALYDFGFTSQQVDPNGRVRFTGTSDIAMLDALGACGGQSNAPTIVRASCQASGPRVHLVAAGIAAPNNPDDVSRIIAGPGGTGSLNLGAFCGPDHGQTLGVGSG